MALTLTHSILRDLDAVSVSTAAKAETRNREVALPPITVYRWWARRTEAINGAILDAASQQLNRPLLVADPFAGGGVIPLAAAIRGHSVYAQDINPWAALGLAVMLELPDADALLAASQELARTVQDVVNAAYATKFSDGRVAEISHTLRVATASCPGCRRRLRLFPHAMVSLERRRERGEDRAFLACAAGHIFRGSETGEGQGCPTCERAVDPTADYATRRIIRCAYCQRETRLEALAQSRSWGWEVALVERSCGRDRELDFPTRQELTRAKDAAWEVELDLGSIPNGIETKVLTRHGFRRWVDIYPTRQLFVTARLLEAVKGLNVTKPVRDSLQMAVVGTTEMAGLLSRWDRYYLKSYESMAGHRFNFTLFTAEPNVWGATASGRGSAIRRLRAFDKASRWLRAKQPVPMPVVGPVADGLRRARSSTPSVLVVEGSSERMLLEDGVVDLLLTDPPYHDDVQYGELSQPLRAWSGLSLEDAIGGAHVNATTGTNTNGGDYRRTLARIFTECRRVIRPDGHLIFSYANREPSAWCDLFGALHDAGFRAAGWAILHSENEGDLAKRGVRACTLDFLMDLVPGTVRVVPEGPSSSEDGDEWEFLKILSGYFCRLSELSSSDLAEMSKALSESEFLAAPTA